jgi:hypothetical protein
MKIILFLLIIFAFVGCKNNTNNDSPKSDSINFDYIDFSFFATNYGVFDIYSVKINNYGKIYIYKTELGLPELEIKAKYFYIATLEKEQLDSVSKMAKTFLKDKLDSTYVEENCCDNMSDFCLIVKSKQKKQKVKYYGDPYFHFEKPISLLNLSKYIDKLSKNIGKTTDSTFIFESYTPYTRPKPNDMN